MTAVAWRSLTAEADRLAHEIERPPTLVEPDGDGTPIVRPDSRARLDRLRDVIRDAEIVETEGVAVIGRLVSFAEEDGTTASYALVAPGEGDPLMGWVSVGSPLGAALLGARAGDRVTFDTPGGRRAVTILAVTEPALS